jgi:hypothetical protein
MQIVDAVREWTGRQEPPHLIVTLGGTGFSVRNARKHPLPL